MNAWTLTERGRILRAGLVVLLIVLGTWVLVYVADRSARDFRCEVLDPGSRAWVHYCTGGDR